MQFKKSKTVLAAILAAAMTCSAVLPTAASAAGTRTKEEAYGDSTYAERFMSLYDDVVTNGQQNGYLSQSSVANGGFAKPGEKFQFVRTGFFTPDSKNPGVYNRVVTLRDSFKPAK